MTYIYAFLLLGSICLVGQIILDNTKLTAGHVTSIFVVIGAILGFLELYEPLRNIAGAGASLPIMSFGDLLFNGGLEGFYENGILGIFKGLLIPVSAGITSAIVFAGIVTLFFKPKE